MKNMNDIREMIAELSLDAGASKEYYKELMADFDRIVGGGGEVFEVEGWSDARYVLFRNEDDTWDWVFEDPIEGPERRSGFSSRRDAMYSMAQDADDTLMLATDMGKRIREAI